MAINFDQLLEDSDEVIINPREIFLTLPKDERFAFLRDVQSEVLKAWFETRDEKDTVIKLNVGSGKTLVGLLLLQSSLNEGVGPAVYVVPDKLLAKQVLDEAQALGIEVTDDEDDSGFQTGSKILVINVYKLFNGKSVFGVGPQSGERIRIGSVIIDDVHACMASINNQFRIKVLSTHPVYQTLLRLFEGALRQQSPPSLLGVKDGDFQKYIEVPFWSWQQKHEEVLRTLHTHKDSEELRFCYDLIVDVLPYCRCVIGGKELEIAPACIPTDVIRSFAGAKRRIYMTATLADDSVLVTAFGAKREHLTRAITPSSAEDMGERMILMPQELNPDLMLADIKGLLKDLAETHNVVVLVPSMRAASEWKDIADQVLQGDTIAVGVERLRGEHVGLTVLINRYDGIDLPKNACRVLAIFDLPEVSSLLERANMSVLGHSKVALRQQIQRVEQGMGRGVRSNEDHCVVVLFGSQLVRRLLSPEGRTFLTSATRAQLDLSKRLAGQMEGATVEKLREAIDQCLTRNRGWVTASKKALLSASTPESIRLDDAQLALRRAFDHVRRGEHTNAAAVLQEAVNAIDDDEPLKAWMKMRLAEVTNFFDRSEAQHITRSAHNINVAVLRPIDGVSYTKLSAAKAGQANAVAGFFLHHFLETPERLLYVQEVLDDLRFEPDTSESFEKAVRDVGAMLGINTQRPEGDSGEGPDNLWALREARFVVIECKNGVTSDQGISKSDVGQLAVSMEWFKARYGHDAHGVPVMFHPVAKLSRGAGMIEGFRVVDQDMLNEFKKNVLGFVKSICVGNTLHDSTKVKNLLHQFGLSEDMLIESFTKAPKSR